MALRAAEPRAVGGARTISRRHYSPDGGISALFVYYNIRWYSIIDGSRIYFGTPSGETGMWWWQLGTIADEHVPGEELEPVRDRCAAGGGGGRRELWFARVFHSWAARCGGSGGAGEGEGCDLQQWLQVPDQARNRQPRPGQPQEGGSSLR